MVRWYVQVSELLPLCVVFRSLLRVAQNLVRGLDLLELSNPLLLLPGMSIGMAFKGELAKGFADVVVAGGCGHAEVRVVIACRVYLRHGDGDGRVEGVERARGLEDGGVGLRPWQADAVALRRGLLFPMGCLGGARRSHSDDEPCACSRIIVPT